DGGFEGGHLCELPWRAWHHAREGCQVAGFSNQCRRYVRFLSCERTAHEWLHAARRRAAANQSARRVAKERPLCGADERRGSFRAIVQRLSWESRRGGTRGWIGRERVRDVPCSLRAKIRDQRAPSDLR